jgi:small-conductance mechanosensitive channel
MQAAMIEAESGAETPETQASETPQDVASSADAGLESTGTGITDPAPATPPEAEGDALQGADAVREAVSQRSRTIGDVVNTLDGYAFQIGATRISVWDAVLVIAVIAGTLFAAFLMTRFAHAMLRRATKLEASRRLLAEKLVTILVWGLAILIGIDLLGIDLTALAVFSGAFGLAIGFGLQKTFGNLIAGIILLMDRSIKPGDVIAIADQAGTSTFGQIRKIGIRAVSVTTRDEREYLIPNENLMVNQVENWSYSSKNVRMQVPVGISYGCDIKRAEELMLEAAKSSKRVLERPGPTVWLDQYGSSSVDFVIHCWIQDPEEGVGNVKSEVLKKLWWLFQEEGIEIPFPQTDLNLRRNEEFDQLVAAISQRVAGKADKSG